MVQEDFQIITAVTDKIKQLRTLQSVKVVRLAGSRKDGVDLLLQCCQNASCVITMLRCMFSKHAIVMAFQL